MKLNKEEKKRFSKLMDSYLVSIGNSILKLNSEDIRSQRFFSVGHAYDEIISEACFNWFVKQKISDIKFLIKKSKFKISSGRLKHPDKKFNFRGSYNSYEISDSFNEKINKTIKQYYHRVECYSIIVL